MLPIHQPLFDPIRLGTYEIKNRLVLAPTHVGGASEKGGRVTDQILCHYFARAKGGAGLVIVEVTGVTGRYAYSSGRGLGAASDRSIPGLADLARVIRWGGAVPVLQLSLGEGAQAFYRHAKRPLVGPSEVKAVVQKEDLPKNMRALGDIVPEAPVPMTADDIEYIKSAALRAAERAVAAGFAGVELHGAHGYLLSQFTSPYFNRRSDAYGGSPANRNRLPVELVEEMRSLLGMEVMVGYRLNAREWIPGGAGLSDAVCLARALEAAGADYLSVTQGGYGAVNRTFPKGEDTITADAGEIRKHVTIPVMCPNFRNPDTAAGAVKNGAVDLVALSRPLLADPRWVDKVRNGNPETITKCIRCYQCVQAAIVTHMPVRCPVNPSLGFERFDPDCRPHPPQKAQGA